LGMFNPTHRPEFSVFFTKCTVELHATKWDDVAKFDKLAVMRRLIWLATQAPENVISNFSPMRPVGKP
jgi:hypothetical protein